MFVQRKSKLTGVTHKINLPCTREQMQAWKNGTLVQNAFPDLDADQRDWIVTGITKEEWDAAFGNK